MRGSQTSPKKIEEIKAIAVETANLAETSRRTGIPESTVHGIIKNNDEFEEFRILAQKEYILNTWGNIQAISRALTKYIEDGRLQRAQLRELTGALKDLRQTVENVMQNINNYNMVNNNSQSNYQLTEEDKTNWSIKYLEGVGYKVEKID